MHKYILILQHLPMKPFKSERGRKNQGTGFTTNELRVESTRTGNDKIGKGNYETIIFKTGNFLVPPLTTNLSSILYPPYKHTFGSTFETVQGHLT